VLTIGPLTKNGLGGLSSIMVISLLRRHTESHKLMKLVALLSAWPVLRAIVMQHLYYQPPFRSR
jgi:hypothetical protein